MKLSAKTFKRELAFRASTLKEVAGILPTGQPVVGTVKVDGELEVCDIDVGAGVAQLWNQNERERVVVAIRDELLDALRRSGHTRLRGAGELYAVDRQGRPLPRNEVMSHVKARTKATTPRADQQALRFVVFDVFQLDDTVLWKRSTYADRFALLQTIFGGGTVVRPVAGRTDVRGEDPIRALWNRHVLEENFEGLVLRTNGAVKVKPVHSADVVVIAIQQGAGQHRDTTGSLVIAFRDWTGRYLEAGRVGTGLTVHERDWWWRTVERLPGRPYGRGAAAARTTFVVPTTVIEVEAESFHQRPVRALRWDAARRQWDLADAMPGAVLQQPRYVGRRTDKSLNPHDLRLEQVPGWKATAAGAKIPSPTGTGTGTAFADLLEAARSDLARFASRLRITPDAREDVIQETNLKALTAWKRLTDAPAGTVPPGTPEPGRSLTSWLYQILENTWRDHQRRTTFRKKRLAELEAKGTAMRARAAMRARVNPKRRTAARRAVR